MTQPTIEPENPRPDLSALRMNREEEARGARKPRWIPIATLAAALAITGFLLPRAPLPWFLPKVETTTVQLITPAQASTVLTATGYTVAQRRASVAAKIVGRVIELRVDEGDPVQEGDVIAILDSEDRAAQVRQAEAAVEEARATLADAEREAARQTKLFEQNLSSEAVRDAALTRRDVAAAKVNTATAALEAARAMLAYAVVRSPIQGVVIEKMIEVGEMVAPGGFASQGTAGSIVRIADLSSLEVEADINESYIARVRPGQPATIRVDAVPEVVYHGKLRQIVPTADRQRAVVEVKVTIEDPDERLVPDMSATVTFLEQGTSREGLEGKPKIVVPAEAVGRSGAEAHVFVVADGKLRRTRVELGELEGGLLSIRSGLSGGETIAKRISEDFRDGRRVRT
jgi:RND family efflux transporter MFP subunit